MNEDTRLSDDALAAIAARVEAVTPGEWVVDLHEDRITHENDWWVRPTKESAIWGICRTGDEHAPRAKEDAEFIAAAPGDMRALLGEIERLRERLAACEGNVTDRSESVS